MDATVGELLNESTAFQMSTSNTKPHTANKNESSKYNSIDNEKAMYMISELLVASYFLMYYFLVKNKWILSKAFLF